MLFNCEHPANQALTPNLINSLPGRDLHAFCWLTDDLIGELDPGWNYLAGTAQNTLDPYIVHFTLGIPSMPGYERTEYADEWRQVLWTQLDKRILTGNWQGNGAGELVRVAHE
jgi:hypothetical protein